jgi:hypothetical protein
MKTQYRLFRRSGVFYLHHKATGKQESLHTRDRADAQRILNARNEAGHQPWMNLQIARAYLAASEPGFIERTWQEREIFFGDVGPGVAVARPDPGLSAGGPFGARGIDPVELRFMSRPPRWEPRVDPLRAANALSDSLGCCSKGSAAFVVSVIAFIKPSSFLSINAALLLQSIFGL